MTESHVVTCFLRHRDAVLLLRRSDAAGAYPGRWGGVAGHAEGDPDAAAREEIADETGLLDAVTFVRRGALVVAEDADLDTRWVVHPYLFDCARRDVRLSEESSEAEWTSPTEILRRQTVPELWAVYAQVAPAVASIKEDRTHGAAYLSLRALEVLRDWAGRLAWQTTRSGAPPARTAATLRALARQLLGARPSMAAVHNRVHRAMHAAHRAGFSAEALLDAAHAALADALEADDAAARHAAAQVAEQRVLTLSRSGTVEAALLQADPAPSVIVAASQPAGEGIGTAERLAAAGLDVTLIPDAALAQALAEESVDLVLVGADAVRPGGAVVNKTGTRLAALAAQDAGCPVYAACATGKIQTHDDVAFDAGDPAALYDGDAALRALNPAFEVTPARLITGLLTERGLLAPGEVAAVADELRARAAWQDASD